MLKILKSKIWISYEQMWTDRSTFQDRKDAYKKNCKYNLGKKRKVSIVFADMIADILSNCRKLSICLF